MTTFNKNIILQLKQYILQKIEHSAQVRAQVNFTEWEASVKDVDGRLQRLDNIELHNITWNGDVNGRIKIVDQRADHYYSPSQKALLFGVIAVGALLAIPAVGIGIERLGCRLVFGFYFNNKFYLF